MHLSVCVVVVICRLTLYRDFLCLRVCVLGEIALAQAISPIATHFSVAWSVVCRLSVVCHTRAPCLNRSTDLHAIWQVHLRGPMTHCVRWGSLMPREEDIGGKFPQPKHTVASDLRKNMIYDPPDRPSISDSAFYQISLVLV